MWKVTGMQQTKNINLNEILNKQTKILHASSHFMTYWSLKAEQLCQAINCKLKQEGIFLKSL